nr:MAG TPA: hypothetical protein [Caudoviricetes sp.]
MALFSNLNFTSEEDSGMSGNFLVRRKKNQFERS